VEFFILMPTSFQKKVWQLCKRIPKGKVTTYKLIAKALGKPRAFRAVGNALNKNPYLGKIPCHRVVKSNGKVGEFVKGKKKKIELLKKEGLGFKKDKIIGFKKDLFRFN